VELFYFVPLGTIDPIAIGCDTNTAEQRLTAGYQNKKGVSFYNQRLKNITDSSFLGMTNALHQHCNRIFQVLF
jgi:hypothetical protein